MTFKMIKDMSNSEYHAPSGAYSSSQIKDMLEDPEYFYKKHVTKELPRKESSAFDVGSYFHTAILEPEKLALEYASFEGRKAGKAWEAFQVENYDKTILNQTQLQEGINLVNATKSNSVAMDLLRGTMPEISFLSKVFGLDVKVRSDAIQLDAEYSYIIDLKSTTGNCKSKHKIKTSIEAFNYDLSAVLYMMAVNEVIKQNDLPYAPVTDFYWIFASKDVVNSQVYRANDEMLRVGTKKLKKAIDLILHYEKKKWKFEDTVEDIEPAAWVSQEWADKEEEVKKKVKKTKVSELTDLI